MLRHSLEPPLIRLANPANWKYGLKTAIAAGICLVLGRFLRLSQSYWACVTSIVVLQTETRDTITASRERLVGTALGAVVGWIASTFWQGHVVVYFVGVLLCMMLPQLLGLKNAGRLAGVTVSIILLVPSAEPHWKVALDRFDEVSFGILVALAASRTIWPKSAMEETPPAAR